MKKILALFAGVLMMAACGANAQETFKGNEYKMLNTPNDVRVMLSFDGQEDRFFGKVANNFFGSYKMDGENITFGPIGSTMMMGSPEMMEVEHSLLQTLPTVKLFKVEGGVLTLTTEDGTTLVFEKTGEVKK